MREGAKPLNAFELINAALNISALFEMRSDTVVRYSRFVSKQPADAIVVAVEAASRRLGATAIKKKGPQRYESPVPTCLGFRGAWVVL